MTGERLFDALRAAGLTQEALAERVGVDTKTVARWKSGSMSPSVYNRRRVAETLGIDDVDELWNPEPALPVSVNNGQVDEIVSAWAHRALVPPELWRRLLRGANHRVDLTGYALLFLPEQDPGFTDVIAEKAAAGCQIRIVLGDPEGPYVGLRNSEEGLEPGDLAARIRTTLRHLAPLRRLAGVDVRLFSAPLYNSIFRYDQEIIYTPHLFRRPGYQTICLHLSGRHPNGLVSQLEQSIETVWRDCRPAWDETA